MKIKRHAIYKGRYKRGYFFALSDAYDADDFITFIDVYTGDLVNLFAYEVWSEVVGLDEIDACYLSCPNNFDAAVSSAAAAAEVESEFEETYAPGTFIYIGSDFIIAQKNIKGDEIHDQTN